MQNCFIWHHTTLVFCRPWAVLNPCWSSKGVMRCTLEEGVSSWRFKTPKVSIGRFVSLFRGARNKGVSAPKCFVVCFGASFCQICSLFLDGLSSISLVDLWWPGKVHNQKKLTNTRWSHPTSAQRNRSWNMIHISKRIKTYKVKNCYIHNYDLQQVPMMFSCTFVHTLYPQILFIHSNSLLYMYSNMLELVP